MKRKFMYLLFCFVSFTALSQSSNTYLHNRYLLERIATQSPGNNTGTIAGLPMAPPSLQGDVYLNSNFNKAVFQLYENERIVEGWNAKLDLKQNSFDILTTQGVRVLDGKLVRSFVFLDSLTNLQSNFVNALEWRKEGGPDHLGFYQILSEGELILVKFVELIFKKADYNVALNVGSRDHKYIKKNLFFYINNGRVIELPGKNHFDKIFLKKENDIKKFMIENDLSIKKEYHLIKIFNQYNLLMKDSE